MKLRFSILGLMALVLLVAVGFAALRSTSALWASAVFTMTVALLWAAILGAFAGRGRARLTWLGFVVFGWIYLLTTFWLWPEGNGVSAPPYLSKHLLDYFQPTANDASTMTIDPGPRGEMGIEPPPTISKTIPGTVNLSTTGPFTGRVSNRLHYRRVGHSLTALLFGLIGAGIGRVFAARTDDPPA